PQGGSATSASISAQGSGAHTSTLAPAAERSSTFHAAASLPPATTTRRPARPKNSGSTSSGCMRRGRSRRGARAGSASRGGMRDFLGGLAAGGPCGDQAAQFGDAAAAVGAGAQRLADRIDGGVAGSGGRSDARGAALEAYAHDGAFVGRADGAGGQQRAAVGGRDRGKLELRLEPVGRRQLGIGAREQHGLEPTLAQNGGAVVA